ncbi:MAG: DUF6036 family nucleotidyltransferase [Myxococcaceae bacterium]
MRQVVHQEQIKTVLAELAKRCKGPGRVYVVGGTTAVLSGWRDSTVDIDMKIGPEPKGIFEAIRDLKNELQVNIELASPDDFMPALPGWEDRSQFIFETKGVTFYHYDFYAQALSKILRAHKRDSEDVQSMLDNNLVTPAELNRLFLTIEPNLIRYPSIDPADFKKKVEAIVGRISSI